MLRGGRFLATGLLAAALVTLAGCEFLYFAQGKGSQPAMYTIPKNARVLVFVDPRPHTRMSPELVTLLGEGIGQHLFTYQAADRFVAQQRLTALRRDGDAFSKMGIADIARACEADIVIHVDVRQYKVVTSEDAQVAEGGAETVVKVVSASGERLFPAQPTEGVAVLAQVGTALTDLRSVADAEREMIGLLKVRTGRLFHKWDVEDKAVNK